MMSIRVESEQSNKADDELKQTVNYSPPNDARPRLIQATSDEDAKNISRQLVDLEILYLLNFGPKSGYQLKKNLFSSFHLNLSYGTLYPHLHSLDKAELISGTWKYQGENAPLRKKMYSLTERGLNKLRKSISSLSKIALTMQFMIAGLDLNSRQKSSTEETQKLSQTLKKAREFFERQGYAIKTGVLLRGFSGYEHYVDLHATRMDGAGHGENLVMKVANSDKGLSIDDLFKTYVMSYDLKATHSIVLSAPTATSEVMKLANFYSVSIYSGNDLDEAMLKMASGFSAQSV